MCGIVCAFELKESSEVLRPKVLSMAKSIRHRGPDWSGIFSNDKALMAHERLAIVDPLSGKQPLFSEDKNYERKNSILTLQGKGYYPCRLGAKRN